MARFGSEISYMSSRWGSALASDPYYSINLSKNRPDFSIAL